MIPNSGPVEEYETWVQVSLLSFWLRFPEEIVELPQMVVRRKTDRDRFLRFKVGGMMRTLGGQPIPLSVTVLLGLAVSAVLLGGCVTHTVTRGDSNAATHTIYKVSEEEAFITILDIYAIEMPKQSVDDIVQGKYRGYNATARFWTDWTHHRVLVIPAKGVDKDGREVDGYWYDIRSSGSRAFENPLRHGRIREAIQQKLGKSAVVVTKLEDREYETDGEAFLGRKRDARDIQVERARTPKSAGSSGRAWVLWKRPLDAYGQPIADAWSPAGGFESQAACDAEKRRLTTGSPVCLPDTIDPRGPTNK